MVRVLRVTRQLGLQKTAMEDSACPACGSVDGSKKMLSIWMQPIVYDTVPDRMSESPASKMAMVEHRKSFPHAVPSSI